MMSLTKESQMDKAKGALRDVVSYADEVVRDERLRADIRAAIGHGATARDRLKKDIADGGITTRLAGDKKLRKNLLALLDDLDSAGDRMRRRKRHRARNVLLIIAGTGAVVAAIPGIRHFLARRRHEFANVAGSNATGA